MSMSDATRFEPRLSADDEARIRARPRPWLPREKWGPKCHGCDADEYRIDGYCSIECRDYHGDEDVIDLLVLVDQLRAQVNGHCERIAKQSELLSKKAETCQECVALRAALKLAQPHLDYEHVPDDVWFAVVKAVGPLNTLAPHTPANAEEGGTE